ncbi:putative N-acetyl-alpha-D-glucosaminyl L-malate deacetylase [Lentibacillus sp. JNUCC-1]|uniref:bacillithiol biosynthesis deacetylase BshB2 n=1 Tax=Lentibacillus sp. JNUCC-1 TaxID=2654513 RepID=UPI0012E9153A|nr:bacillithiol biosynthesis deacetylase BshB2 [Lentibacillus sp. JNUCC-1]MUV39081.1 putative N-acetyl-alpha-D-glucosaminyl L-malate deacetylase [Lentibacillus sp. JNUCC-1]
MESHVVVIFPHPDDESFGTAGTIAKFREEGVPVTYLCGTLGEMGRNMGKPAFANRETLPKIRKQELQDACAALDIDLHMLGYRDKTMEYEDRQEVARHLKTYLDEIQPSLVITHYPGYAVHPDHNAMAAAAIEAIRMMEPNNRPKVWAHAISNNREEVLGKPDVSLDVRPWFDQKMKAIFAHDSQASGMMSKFKEAQSSSVDMQEAAERHLGHEQYHLWQFDDA